VGIIHYCAPPEDKWLLVGLFNNTTQSHILDVLLATTSEELSHWWENFLSEKDDLDILILTIKLAFKTKINI